MEAPALRIMLSDLSCPDSFPNARSDKCPRVSQTAYVLSASGDHHEANTDRAG